MRNRLPAVNAAWVAAFSAAYILFLTNGTFWARLTAFFAGDQVFLVLFSIALYLLHFAALLALSGPYILRPAYIALFLIAASAGYYTDAFGAMMDRDMMRSVFQTTPTESVQLMTPSFAWRMLLLGGLPSLIVAILPISRRPPWRQTRLNIALILGGIAASAAILATNLGSFMPFWQRERELTMSYLNPAMAVFSSADLGLREYVWPQQAAAPYGRDARPGARIAAAGGPTILVLVVGETARAQNFTLTSGYARDTTPELAARDVVAFKDVTACGTSTAISMPCMFSHLGMAGYSKRKAYASENLVDVLRHAGYKVEWWENNTGAKGIAALISVDMIAQPGTPELCGKGECLDEILARKLERALPAIKADTVLILHTMGSHGPSYFKRYPDEFARFKPDCRTPELTSCSQEELVNAYDNTILYTDHMLARFIDILKSRPDASTAMFYMSDHGESLGEGGLYLHGAPYRIAPDYQKKIPAIAWFSDAYARRMKLDRGCAEATESTAISHDNMFDTVLGIMDVQTSIYKPALDIFRPCRAAAVSASRS